MRERKKIRCSEHPSATQANAKAAASQDGVKRGGVVGKSWVMTRSSSSFSSFSSLKNTENSDDEISGTGTGGMEMGMLYEGRVGRKRFDVWSRVYYGRREEGKRETGQQRLVFECGGEEEEKTEGEKKGETDDETEDDNDEQTQTPNNHRASSVSSTATLTFPAHTSPLDLIETATKLHGTYTTLVPANRAALATFLALAKPQNSAIADNLHYQHDAKPRMEQQFDDAGLGARGCATLAELEWDPPGGRPYRWPFLRVVVEVVESELQGPVEIGDMEGEGEVSEGEGEVSEEE
ncbi:hypothetical protein C8A00DRAFT_40850 [Chaetomidium leptoderma]|uniref:Uncharacterized protein n=1 Tax=Chaetomidium leptoderma TaxID=669021 RepID=A0AAN6ZZP0_9PEZI|nr:hypothetical protein C8A00DRAFT_40850 [Chaetomidium leptoderma]